MAVRVKKKKAYGSGSSLLGGPDDSAFKPFNVNGPSVGAVTPTAPAWTPAPSDSGLEQQYSAYDAQAQNATAGYRQQAGDLLRDYGFQGDPNNPYSFGGVDPNNPFSKAALLKKSFDEARRGAANSYGARGMAFDGAAQRAQDRALNQYQQGENTLLSSLKSNLGALSNAEAGVGAQLAAQKASAYEAFLARQVQQRPPDPVAGYDPSLPPISSKPAPALTAKHTPRQGAARKLGVPKKKKGKR